LSKLAPMTFFDHRQTGSAFWIILIAIALFGGLSFALIESGRTGASNLSTEQIRLAATEIISYGDSLSKGVQKLRLTGCSDTQFDFENAVWQRFNTSTLVFAAGHNPSAGAGCSVFGHGEGDIKPTIIPLPSLYEWAGITSSDVDFGHGIILSMRIPGLGLATREELIYRLAFVDRAVCLKINDILGITNPSNAPPAFTSALAASTALNRLYAGTYPDDSIMTDTSGNLTGKAAFCASHGVSDPEKNSFFQVLIVR
jgi:hypothetical protein